MPVIAPSSIPIWLARHGESKNTIDGRYGGTSDFPLTARGRRQATALALQAESSEIRHVITSPLLRARQTAEIIVNRLPDAKLHLVEDLCEWNSYGVLSGLNSEEAYNLFPKVMLNVNGEPENPSLPIPGAEPRKDFHRRVKRAFGHCLQIAEHSHPRLCLVIVHGKFLHELITSVLLIDERLSYETATLYGLAYEKSHSQLRPLSLPGFESERLEYETMNIYLVRHGEAEDDLDDSYGGAADHQLTAKGEAQARTLAGQLTTSGISRIYTSPQRRASKTATVIAIDLGIPSAIQVIDDLRERNSYGVLSGIPKAKACELFPLILRPGEIRSGHSKEALLGAEAFDLFVDRVAKTFDTIVREAINEGFNSIAVVTHGTWLRTLLNEHLGICLPQDWKHGSTLRLEYSPAKATISRP